MLSWEPVRVDMRAWVATDSEVLDVTSSRAWKRLFTPVSIDRLMAEHLFEHLSEPIARLRSRNAFGI